MHVDAQRAAFGDFTDAVEAQKSKSNRCKHCKSLVNYHKKSEQVQSHFNNCRNFLKLMNGIEDPDRLNWYLRNKKRTKKNAVESVDILGRQTSMKQFTVLAVTKQERDKFQKHVEMHFYATGMHFQRVEDVHLQEAIRTQRPDA